MEKKAVYASIQQTVCVTITHRFSSLKFAHVISIVSASVKEIERDKEQKGKFYGSSLSLFPNDWLGNSRGGGKSFTHVLFCAHG